MNKKTWCNPSVTNLSVCKTNEGVCSAATGAKHSFGPLPDCKHYCTVCGGCTLRPFYQNFCAVNAIKAIKSCDGNCTVKPPSNS